MHLIVASPTYGPTDPRHNRSLRVAIMHAASHGHQWVGDASPDRETFAAARNNAVQSVIDEVDQFPDDTAILWSDSDMLWPIDGITQLADAGKDFITGVYYQRRKPHWPLVSIFNESINAFNFICEWPENCIVPVDACGFGCVLTTLGMLRKMPAPWFEFHQFSEDFTFCMKAQKAGYQLYFHTGVACGHIGDGHVCTRTDFEPHWEKLGKIDRDEVKFADTGLTLERASRIAASPDVAFLREGIAK